MQAIHFHMYNERNPFIKYRKQIISNIRKHNKCLAYMPALLVHKDDGV